jgi:hypothetical protein
MDSDTPTLWTLEDEKELAKLYAFLGRKERKEGLTSEEQEHYLALSELMQSFKYQHECVEVWRTKLFNPVYEEKFAIAYDQALSAGLTEKQAQKKADKDATLKAQQAVADEGERIAKILKKDPNYDAGYPQPPTTPRRVRSALGLRKPKKVHQIIAYYQKKGRVKVLN